MGTQPEGSTEQGVKRNRKWSCSPRSGIRGGRGRDCQPERLLCSQPSALGSQCLGPQGEGWGSSRNEGGNRTSSILKAGLHLGPDCGLWAKCPVSMEMTYQLESQATRGKSPRALRQLKEYLNYLCNRIESYFLLRLLGYDHKPVDNCPLLTTWDDCQGIWGSGFVHIHLGYIRFSQKLVGVFG